MKAGLHKSSVQLINKYIKLLANRLETSDDHRVDIDKVIDSDFISTVEKLIAKLQNSSLLDEATQKLEMDPLNRLGNNLIRNEHRIMTWYTIHKTTIIKVEKDEETAEIQECKEEALFDLEKKEFSLVPLLNILTR